MLSETYQLDNGKWDNDFAQDLPQELTIKARGKRNLTKEEAPRGLGLKNTIYRTARQSFDIKESDWDQDFEGCLDMDKITWNFPQTRTQYTNDTLLEATVKKRKPSDLTQVASRQPSAATVRGLGTTNSTGPESWTFKGNSAVETVKRVQSKDRFSTAKKWDISISELRLYDPPATPKSSTRTSTDSRSPRKLLPPQINRFSESNDDEDFSDLFDSAQTTLTLDDALDKNGLLELRRSSLSQFGDSFDDEDDPFAEIDEELNELGND